MTVEPTDLGALGDRFVLEYDQFLPTGEFVDTVFCNAFDTNLDTEGTEYKAACLATRTAYGVKDKEITFTAPYIRDKPTADNQLKYLINQRRATRLFIEVDLWGTSLTCGRGTLSRSTTTWPSASRSSGTDGARFPILAARVPPSGARTSGTC